ncbi:hypothetical protein IWX50DRAFT_51099 [Phyllosticta citricarpa]
MRLDLFTAHLLILASFELFFDPVLDLFAHPLSLCIVSPAEYPFGWARHLQSVKKVGISTVWCRTSRAQWVCEALLVLSGTRRSMDLFIESLTAGDQHSLMIIVIVVGQQKVVVHSRRPDLCDCTGGPAQT